MAVVVAHYHHPIDTKKQLGKLFISTQIPMRGSIEALHYFQFSFQCYYGVVGVCCSHFKSGYSPVQCRYLHWCPSQIHLIPMLHNEFFVLLTGLHFITPCESFLLTIPKIPITSPIHTMQQLNGHCDCAGLSECFCRVLSQLWSSAVVTGVGSRFYFFLPRLSLPLYSNQNKNRAPNGDS